MPDMLKIYHSSPYLFRVLVASLRGYYLRAIRYSPKTDQWIAEALEKETWSAERLKSWQEEKLASVLHFSATNVPYYREYWQKRRRQGDNSSFELLDNWPVLSKDALRENPRLFVADGLDLKAQVEEHTSGTSGKPLTLWMSKDIVRQWYALFDARWRNWYGLSRHDRWGILGGQLVTPYAQKSAPFWVWNHALHQLYLSSYHLAPENIPAYVQAIRDYRLVYLFGYASSLYALAKISLEKNIPVPRLKAVISNAEPFFDHQREAISLAFQCSVYDTYGQSELVSAASECVHGRLHLWPEAGITEIFADDADVPVSPGGIGRIIATGLINMTMPLIRYQVGDRASLGDPGSVCACGRSMPVLSGIEGRMDDVVITLDGRRVGRLDPVFKANLPVREAQIIQESASRLRVKYISAHGFSAQDANSIVERLQERVGKMQIVLEEVDNIPRSANGKFRSVVSELSNR